MVALQLIGANFSRLGVEWSRLEPTPGAWDEAAAARYREMFAGLRFTVIMLRMGRLLADTGLVPPEFARDNLITRALADLLDRA